MGDNLRRCTRALVVSAVGAVVLAVAGSGGIAAAGLSPRALSSEREILAALADAPLRFVENVGQAHSTVRAIAQGPGYSFAFGANGLRFAVVGPSGTGRASARPPITLRFVGANPNAKVEVRRPFGVTLDSLVGDRDAWRAGLPTYRELVYRDLWPGVDAAFTGSRGTLKYEFRLRPGADPRQVRLAYAGAETLELTSKGALDVRTSAGRLTDAAPVGYQRPAGWRVDVRSRFELHGPRVYGFAVGSYDPTKTLVIDPALDYSTYVGGSGEPEGGNVVVVQGHDAYVVGSTASPDMPVTADAAQPVFRGMSDAFVIRLDTRKAGAAALEYGTFIGGSFPDDGLSVAVDGRDVYVTGLTTSPNFPVTPDAYDTAINGPTDAYVTRLDTNRSGAAALVYSTYLGGGGPIDVGLSIGIEGHDAYVTGTTTSPNFPVTAGAVQPTTTGFDGFVSRIATDVPGAAGLVYSTFLGGAGPDSGRGIAVREGDAFVVGPSASPNFPVTPDAFDPTYNGGLDVTVSRIDTDVAGSAGLEYSTYLGGSGDEDTFTRPGSSIALLANDVYVVSLTTSPNFPVTANAFDPTPNGGQDAFVTQLDTARAGAAGLAYSTYLGGTADDIGRGVAVFGGDVYVTGGTFSVDFPVTAGAAQATSGGGRDIFVTRLDTRTGAAGLVYSSYLGGSADDVGRGVAVLEGAAYVTGETRSPNFPTTPDAFQPADRPGEDAFLARLDTRR